MSTPLPSLLMIAGLLLLIGVLAISVIILVAKRCRSRTDNKDSNVLNETENLSDPWAEAGKRAEDESTEHE